MSIINMHAWTHIYLQTLENTNNPIIWMEYIYIIVKPKWNDKNKNKNGKRKRKQKRRKGESKV